MTDSNQGMLAMRRSLIEATADLALPDACPCCGAGVVSETRSFEADIGKITRTYGDDNATTCRAVLGTHEERQKQGEAPSVHVGCREATVKACAG